MHEGVKDVFCYNFEVQDSSNKIIKILDAAFHSMSGNQPRML